MIINDDDNDASTYEGHLPHIGTYILIHINLVWY